MSSRMCSVPVCRAIVLAQVLAMLVIGGGSVALGQANPRGEAALRGSRVRVDYGRPAAKGRDLMDMVQPDFYWRMGADTATILMTQVELKVGEESVPKGEYTLLGYFKSKEEFELVFARDVSPGSRVPKDVAGRVKGRIETGQENVERLTIELEEHDGAATFILTWGSSRITAPFEVRS